MKLSLSGKAARAAMLCAVAARVFLGLAVEMPTTHNGAWLSALIGSLLAAPWAVLMGCIRQSRLFRAVLLLYVLADAASVLSSLTRSAGYLALDRASPLLLAVPAAAAALWCATRSGNAVGYAAMIWARLALFLLFLVTLLQWRYYRPEWLAPMLGNGWLSIVDGGIRSAGWIVSAAAVLAVSGQEDEPLSALPMLFGGLLAAAALLLLAGMLTPTTLSGAWLNRLDDLLCNGRTPLYLQLPLIVLWFAALMHLLAIQCFSAAALLQHFIHAHGKLCALLAVAAVLALSRSGFLTDFSAFIARWGFVAIGMIAALSMLFQKGERTICGSIE